MLFTVDLHIAFHGGKYASFKVRRAELRIGSEVQTNGTSLLSCVCPHKSIGQNPEKIRSLLIIVLCAFAPLRLFPRVLDEPIHLLALLRFRNRLTIAFDYATETSGLRFSHPLL